MKRKDDWLVQIQQACYNAEVGDFQEMDALIAEIMALDIAAQQSVQADGGYCMCNPNEAPYKIGSKLCAVCEKPSSATVRR